MASKLLFWFPRERYFLNSSFLLWYSHLEQSFYNRERLLKLEWQLQTFFLKICFSVLVLLCLSGNMQSRRKRGGKGWGLYFVAATGFWPCRFFYRCQNITQVWIVYCSCSPLFLVLISLWCALNFSYLGLLRILSNQILNFCKDGDSTAPFGNLFQCSATLPVGFFFLMLCFSLHLHSLITFLVCLGSVVSHPFTTPYLKSGSDFSVSIL